MANRILPCGCTADTDDDVVLALHPLTCPAVPEGDAIDALVRVRAAVVAGWHPAEAVGAAAPV